MNDAYKNVAAMLTPGRILFLENDFAPTDKFLVVAAANEKILFFAINTRIEPFNQRDDARRRSQVRILKADHERFLSHDSWIDCSKVISSLSKRRVLQRLAEEPQRIKGQLTSAEREAIVAVLKSSPFFQGDFRRELLAAWNAADTDG